MEDVLISGRDDICRALDMPWPAIVRLVKYAGLPIRDPDGPEPVLVLDNWHTWKSRHWGGNDDVTGTA